MKKIIIFIILTILFIPSASAYSKEDIFNLVNSQSVCDGSTSVLFNSYKTTYTRLLKEKDLTEQELTIIYNSLTSALDILNSNNVCRLRDLSNLDNNEKQQVLNSLITGSNIITKASNNKDTSGIVIDKSDSTIKIYDSGVLVDKLNVEEVKLTYTGPSIFISGGIIFLFILIGLYIYFRKKDNKLILDFVTSLIFVTSLLIVPQILFKDDINSLTNIRKLFSKINIVDTQLEIIVDINNKIIKYPKYSNIYASLSIPNLGILNEVSFGDDQSLLKNYIGHYTATSLPGEGSVIVYSGHNSSKMLGNIKNINNDEVIIINTSYGEFKYQVYDTKIINDNEVDKVLINNETETLVLYTCYPFSNVLYGSKRMVVYASLIDSRWLNE